MLITVATRWEAEPFLSKHFPETRLEIGAPFSVTKGVSVMLTGMGRKRVGQSLRRICTSYFPVVNIGLAGSLDEFFRVGNVFRASVLYNGGGLRVGFAPHMSDFLAGLKEAELETHNLPVLWSRHRKAKRLADMEAAIYAHRLPGAPIAFVKVVSDYCSLPSLIASLVSRRERAKIKSALLGAFEGVVFG